MHTESIGAEYKVNTIGDYTVNKIEAVLYRDDEERRRGSKEEHD